MFDITISSVKSNEVSTWDKSIMRKKNYPSNK